MKKNAKLFIGLACLSLGLTACSDDYFDKEAYDAKVKEAFPVDNIDPTHTWATMGSVTMNVSVNGDYGKNYRIAVYQENPLYVSPLTLLTSENIKSGEKANLEFSFPLASTTLYVAAYDELNRRVVKTVNVEDNGSYNIVFFGATIKARGTRATEAEWTNSTPAYAKTLGDYLNPDIEPANPWDSKPVTREISVADMEQYPELSDNLIVNETNQGNRTLSDMSWNYTPAAYPGGGDGKHFKVPEGRLITELFHINGTSGVYNDAVIYIKGTLHLKGNTLNGPTLVVAAGGKIILDSNTQITNAGRFVVMSGGQIIGEDGVVFTATNGSPCYNAGLIEYDGELNVNGSNMYNCGTVKVDLLRNTSGGKFTNFGTIEARTNTGPADAHNSTIVNACYMKYTENAGLGSIVLLNNSLLDVGGVAEFGNNTTGTLYHQSMLNVGSLYVNSTAFYGTDNTSDYAIIKTSRVIFAGDLFVNQDKNDWYNSEATHWQNRPRNLEGKGTIYLDWDNSESYDNQGNKLADTPYTRLGMVKDGNYNYITEATALSTVSIPASDCTGDGYNTTTPPIDPPVEEIKGYRFCFEDNFPQPGDYDFNDCVITITPERDGNTVELTVSLDAVGATKQIGAALMIRGISDNDIQSISCNGNMDNGFGGNILIKATNKGNNVYILSAGQKGYSDNGEKITDLVFRLFNDAHYAISGNAKSYDRAFYNTVSPSSIVDVDKRSVNSRTIKYTITLNNEEKAKIFDIQDNYDLFIVEKHNGRAYEVHTRYYKFFQVLGAYYNGSKFSNYEDTESLNYPWAISVFHSNINPFRYPIEWNSISGTKIREGIDENSYGFTYPAYPNFKNWASNQNNDKDWYLYPEEGLVY